MLNRSLLTFLITNLATASAYFVLNCGLLVTERADPIVAPGLASQHVHSISGASNFGTTISYDSLINSSCTTCNTQIDKSSYWAPSLYHQALDGTFSIYRLGNTRIYYKYSTSEDVKPFPKGLQVISGDPARKTFNTSAADNQAIRFMCLGSAGQADGESTAFPDKACLGGIQLQIWFPTCWDGVSTTAPDHKSHMSFAVEGYNGDICPSSHPVKVPQLMYEFIFMTGEKDYHGAGTYVLANGDTTGYGFHGDFVSAWDNAPDAPLAQALKSCGADSTWGEVYGCPPLNKYADQTAQSGCSIEPVIREDVGLTSSLAKLPGCNLLWSAGPKPTCGSSISTSASVMPVVTNTPNVVLSTSSAVSAGSAQITSALPNNAVPMDILPTPISTKPSSIPDSITSQLAIPTIGIPDAEDYTSTSTITITSYVTVPAACTSDVNVPSATAIGSVPSPWISVGCVSLSENRMPILIASVTSDDINMTIENCQHNCLGFSYAGLMQGSICTCGNNVANGVRNTVDSAQCSIKCTGDESNNCGGDWNVSLFLRLSS
ncbi:WSC domain-containing protein 2 [Neolecta irregularis DAH-3]|uniref:WSC domain-containing protein 2 n=1 Tax=Neolecta irregularis (strain DAH-3) TaxID=1198029 RepID=A0A1U7LP29_NEOID|nr:WSC domain-containing protein 2 [Neolecta irregularis DAH-3]|eukprot:OLL24407.1 WSC domain-containing protein 2 [Neolecta irregularis DAH-3]